MSGLPSNAPRRIRSEERSGPPDGYTASGVAQKVWAEFTQASNERIKWDLQWWVWYQNYRGRVDVFFDGYAQMGPEIYQVEHNGPRERRIRPINHTGHAIDILTSKQVKPRPVFTARPNSNEERDIMAARATRDWLRHIFEKECLASRRRLIYLDRNVTGNSFVKPYYDKFGAPFVDEQADCSQCAGEGKLEVEGYGKVECPACGGNGKSENTYRKALGDVKLTHCRPWEIYPAPGATSVEDAEYVFHAYKISRELAAARYGMKKSDINPSSWLEHGESSFAKWARANRVAHFHEDAVFVLEKYMPPLPGEEHPRIAVVVGDKVVWPKPDGRRGRKKEQAWARMKEPYGRIPIFHFKSRPVPGQFFSDGKVEEMMNANDTVNRFRSILHRSGVTMAYAKWMVEKGSISAEAINNEENEVVEYWGNNPPKQVSPAPLPEYLFRTIEREEKAVYDIAGVSDLERGRVPPNVEAALSFEVLIEQSETSQGPIVLDDAETWKQVALSMLRCAMANYKDDERRVVNVIGQGGQIEAKALAKSDLSANLDIVTELGSAIDQSRALKRQSLLEYFQSGAFDENNPAAKKLLELAEFGTPGAESLTEQRLQESVIALENEGMEKFQDQEEAPHEPRIGLDDHALHARGHRMAALRALLRGDPQAAMRLAQAAIDHMNIMNQAAAGGAPPAAKGGQMPNPEPDAGVMSAEVSQGQPSAPPQGAET